MATGSSRGLFERMPTYRGLPSESLGTFFEKFRSLSTFEGWDEAACCRKIVAFLGGRALRAYNDFPNATRTDWTRLKQALMDKFQPPGYSHIWQSAWASRDQLPGEPAAAYLDHLRSLAKDAFPSFTTEAQRDDVVRARFLAGLSGPIRMFINVHHTTSPLEELERAVNHYEMGQKLSQGVDEIVPQQDIERNRVFAGFALRTPGPTENQFVDQLSGLHLSHPQGGQANVMRNQRTQSTSSSHHSSTRGGRSRASHSQHSNSRRGSRGPPQWTADNRPICLNCGIAGHMIRECRRRGRGTSAPASPRGRGQSRGRQATVRLVQELSSAELLPESEEASSDETTRSVHQPSAAEYEETIELLQQQNQLLQQRLSGNVYMVQSKLLNSYQPDQLATAEGRNQDLGHPGSRNLTLARSCAPWSEDGQDGMSHEGNHIDLGPALWGRTGHGANPASRNPSCPLEVAVSQTEEVLCPQDHQSSTVTYGGGVWTVKLVPLLVLSLLVVAVVSAAGPTLLRRTLHFCEGPTGTQLWGLPSGALADRDALIAMDLWKASKVNITQMTLQRYRLSRPMPTMATNVCQCELLQLHLFHGPLSGQWFSKYESMPLPISELECHRMIHWQESPHGPLHWMGSGWSTNHTWPPVPKAGWSDCCRWRAQTLKQCYLYNTSITPTEDGSWTSPAISTFYNCTAPGECSDIVTNCPVSAGMCHLTDLRILMWPKQRPTSGTRCANPDGSPVTGTAFIGKHHFGDMLRENRTVALDRGVIWFPASLMESPVVFLTTSPIQENHATVPACSDGSLIRGTWGDSLQTFFRSVPAPLSTEFQAPSKHDLQLRWALHELARKDMLAVLNGQYERDPSHYLRELFHMPNVTAVLQGPLLATRQCYSRVNVQFRVVADSWPPVHEQGSARLPIHISLPEGSLLGYWDPTKDFVYANANPIADRLVRDMHESVKPDTNYMLPQFNVALNSGTSAQVPPQIIATYHPYLGHHVWPLLSISAQSNFLTFRATLFPWLEEGYPTGLLYLWLFAVIIYGTMAVLILHCCPTWHFLRYLNPFRMLFRFIRHRYCSGGCCLKRGRNRSRSQSPRERRQLLPLSRTRSRLMRQGRCSRSRSPPLYITDLHGNRIRVNQLKSGSKPHYMAACYVKIGPSKLRALLDTGANISLISEEQVRLLGLPIDPVVELQGATGLSGHEVPLLGCVQADIKIGSKTLSTRTLYVVDDLEGFDLILGVDCLAAMGPILFHFAEGIVRLYEKPPKNGGECIPIGEESWPVTLSEPVVLPPRSEVLLPAAAPAAPAAVDHEFEPSLKLEQQHKVTVAHALVRPQKGKVMVRLLNTHLQPVKLYKGTTVGRLSLFAERQHVRMLQGSAQSTKDPLEELDFSGCVLNSTEQGELRALLSQYKDIFSMGSTDLGCIPGVEHQIDTQGNPPIRQRPYRTEFSQRQTVRDHIQQMQNAGVVRPSCSPWAAPVVLVKKRDQSMRFCVDFRKLNAITCKDSFPLPLISEVLDSLGKAKYFSSVDLTSAYWHVRVAEQDVPKTAFVTFDGTYEFVRMPFGLTGAPGTFQRAMQHALSGLAPHIALIYLDDVLVHSETFTDHLKDLQAVFERFRKYNLKLKAKKCSFCPAELEYLGHLITRSGLRPDPAKVKAVAEFPPPQGVPGLKRFLGMAGFYRRFIPGFSQKANPLFSLEKKGVPYVWGDRQETAFNLLKKLLTEAPVLAYPRFDRPFVFETDASTSGLGCVLSQEDDEKCLRVIAYASRSLTAAEKNYSITELECLAVTWSLKLFRPYAYGHPCKIITDHQALRWLLSQASPSGRLNRWSLALQEYQLEIIYRPGRKNEKADALSRAPLVASLTSSDRLCKAQKNDPICQLLVDYLQNGHLPIDPVEKREVLRLAPLLQVQDGCLKTEKPHTQRSDGVEPRLFVPASLRKEVLQAYHGDTLGGHQGVQKTSDKIQLRYFWPRLERDVRDFVRSCPECQGRKNPIPAQNPPVQHIQSRVPFEILEVDVMELPLSYNGNRYLVVFIDHFTKYPEAFATADQTAGTIARLLFEGICCRHGAPAVLLSDRGSNFLSRLVQELCKIMDIRKATSTPYAPQTQGLVERLNRSLQDLLAKMVKNDQPSWDQYLPQALLAIRSAIQATTGESPHYLLYGQDIRLPIDRAFHYSTPFYADVDDLPYIEALQHRLTNAWRHVHNRQQAQQEREPGEEHNLHDVKVGDFVLLKIPNYPGRAAKLGLTWSGPFEVVHVHVNNNIDIQDLGYDKPPLRVHRRRIKPYYPRAAAQDKPSSVRGPGHPADPNLEAEAD